VERHLLILYAKQAMENHLTKSPIELIKDTCRVCLRYLELQEGVVIL
jgi:hypothetical protein